MDASANGEDAEAQAMLEYTLRWYASEPLEITWMKLHMILPRPGIPIHKKMKGGTRAAGQRHFRHFAGPFRMSAIMKARRSIWTWI